MKKVFLTMAAVAMIFATACKKETTETTPEEVVTTVENEVSKGADALEASYNEAVAKLEEAKKSGDKEAEKLAIPSGTPSCFV